MRELALGGDRVELLLAVIRSPDRAKAKPSDDFLRDQRRHYHEAQAVECEDVHERRVFDFSDQSRTNSNGMKLLCERQCASAASEKFFPKHAFQRCNLRADGGLGDVQFLRRLPHAAFLGDHPEVTHVMLVQKFHRKMVFALTFQSCPKFVIG